MVAKVDNQLMVSDARCPFLNIFGDVMEEEQQTLVWDMGYSAEFWV